MPRKKRADVRDILRKRIEEPETAKRIAETLLSFLDIPPEKVKPGDVWKIIDLLADEQGKEPEAEIPDPSEDFSQYSDAELWDWLRRLEGGKARGP